MGLPSLRNHNSHLSDFPQSASWAGQPPSLRTQYLEGDSFTSPPLTQSAITEMALTQAMMQSHGAAHSLSGHHNRPDQFYPSPSAVSSWPHHFVNSGSDGGSFYRHSASNSHSNLPGISLPPLRTLEPNHAFATASAGHNMHNMPQLHGLYSNSMYPPQVGLMSSVNGQFSGFNLPGADQRLFTGSRQKKEIKRRTKTGCLTCRKRRIKVCDTGDALHLVMPVAQIGAQ